MNINERLGISEIEGEAFVPDIDRHRCCKAAGGARVEKCGSGYPAADRNTAIAFEIGIGVGGSVANAVEYVRGQIQCVGANIDAAVDQDLAAIGIGIENGNR